MSDGETREGSSWQAPSVSWGQGGENPLSDLPNVKMKLIEWSCGPVPTAERQAEIVHALQVPIPDALEEMGHPGLGVLSKMMADNIRLVSFQHWDELITTMEGDHPGLASIISEAKMWNHWLCGRSGGMGMLDWSSGEIEARNTLYDDIVSRYISLCSFHLYGMIHNPLYQTDVSPYIPPELLFEEKEEPKSNAFSRKNGLVDWLRDKLITNAMGGPDSRSHHRTSPRKSS